MEDSCEHIEQVIVDSKLVQNHQKGESANEQTKEKRSKSKQKFLPLSLTDRVSCLHVRNIDLLSISFWYLCHITRWQIITMTCTSTTRRAERLIPNLPPYSFLNNAQTDPVLPLRPQQMPR